MLNLKLPTDPHWADLATRSLDDILNDHLYCEQKAASNAISLIVRHPEKQDLVDTLTEVAAEEWAHFAAVLKEIRARGITLQPQRVDEYALRLTKCERKGGSADDRLLDKLLICAIIEARSCERFKILSETVPDPPLAQFYYDLMVSEAGHYTVFTDLARVYHAPNLVDKRLHELLEMEADILATQPVRLDRVH